MQRFAIFILALVAAAAQRESGAEARLQAAINKETVEGDLKSAIELYKKAAQSPNRAVAAKALVRMGQCYEKLGDVEARKTYERAVREFGDQKDTIATARARLAAMGGPADASSKGVRVRLLWDGAVSGNGTASDDGRWLSFPNWETSDVGIRDVVSGETRRVTNRGDAKKSGETLSTAISPDGKRIAFVWYRYPDLPSDKGESELRLIGADGKGEQVLLDGKRYGYIVPRSWSNDGKWIVVMAGGQNGPTLMLVSPDGMPLRALRVLDGVQPGTTLLSRDGKWLAFDAPVGGVSRRTGAF